MRKCSWSRRSSGIRAGKRDEETAIIIIEKSTQKLGRFVDSLLVTNFTPPSPIQSIAFECAFFASLQIERVFRRNLFLYLISDFVSFFSITIFCCSILSSISLQHHQMNCERKGLFFCDVAHLFPFFFSASAPIDVFIPMWWDFYQQTNANEKLIYFCNIYRSHWFAAEYCSRQNSNEMKHGYWKTEREGGRRSM